MMARVGPRNLLVAGLSIIFAGLVILAIAGQDSGYAPSFLTAYALLGAGGGMSFLPLLTISMSEAPMADAGLASGFSNVLMQVGGALGLAVIGTVSTSYSQGYAGFQLAYVLAAVSVAVALGVVLAVLRTPVARATGHQSARVEIEEAA